MQQEEQAPLSSSTKEIIFALFSQASKENMREYRENPEYDLLVQHTLRIVHTSLDAFHHYQRLNLTIKQQEDAIQAVDKQQLDEDQTREFAVQEKTVTESARTGKQLLMTLKTQRETLDKETQDNVKKISEIYDKFIADYREILAKSNPQDDTYHVLTCSIKDLKDRADQIGILASITDKLNQAQNITDIAAIRLNVLAHSQQNALDHSKADKEYILPDEVKKQINALIGDEDENA